MNVFLSLTSKPQFNFCFFHVFGVYHFRQNSRIHHITSYGFNWLLFYSADTYSFSDVDLDDCRGAEGRLAPVAGLHHQRPGAVSLLGDVLNDGHRLDIGLEHDLPRVSIDVKDVVVWIRFHDGILDDIVGYFCIIVYSLCGCRYVQFKMQWYWRWSGVLLFMTR